MLTYFCDHVIHISLPSVPIRILIVSFAQHDKRPNTVDGRDLKSIYGINGEGEIRNRRQLK